MQWYQYVQAININVSPLGINNNPQTYYFCASLSKVALFIYIELIIYSALIKNGI